MSAPVEKTYLALSNVEHLLLKGGMVLFNAAAAGDQQGVVSALTSMVGIARFLGYDGMRDLGLRLDAHNDATRNDGTFDALKAAILRGELTR